MKKKILITCAGGSNVLYLAKKLSKKYDIILADADKYCAGLNNKYKAEVIPMGNDNNFMEIMLHLIKKAKVDYVVPGADEELLKFWDIKERYNKFELVLPCKEFVNMCLNKGILMEKLKEKNISNIPTYNYKNIKFPLMAKPLKGRGSRYASKINNLEQLEGYFKLYKLDPKSILLHKYIKGDEYTISVIVNNKNKLIGIVPKKIIIKRGITRIAITEYNELINNVCKKIVQVLKPFGLFNVQLKIYENKAYIFEINPRLSTTSVLTDNAFGNEIDLFITTMNKDDIVPNLNFKTNVVMARYEDCVFYKK